MSRIVALAVVVVTSACAGESRRGGTESQAERRVETARAETSTRDSVLKSLSDYGNSFGDDRSSVITRLGAPSQVTMIDPKGGAYRYHPAAPLSRADSFFVLHYPTASFEVTASAADGSEMLWTVRVWGALPGLPSVLSPSKTTRSRLLAVLGEADYPVPPAGDSTILSYQSFGRFSELIDFYIVRDTVRLIRWQFRIG